MQREIRESIFDCFSENFLVSPAVLLKPVTYSHFKKPVIVDISPDGLTLTSTCTSASCKCIFDALKDKQEDLWLTTPKNSVIILK